MAKLAINGGEPVRKELFPAQNTVGKEEIEAVTRVMSGHAILTGYQGNFGPAFYGGREIRKLEEEWAQKFGVRHAICCNSATSGLFIACGAVGLHGPGENTIESADEAIVSPFSMTCSATAPMGWGARPIFADIERDYYCIDPGSVEVKRTPYVKAIIPVSLFGQPYDAEQINAIAEKNRAYIIEDAAQALGSKLNGKYAGTLGDIGVFSFNLGKHLTCGEGGMIVTDDDELAMRCRLIMNHAEAVVNDMARHTGNQGGVGDVAVERYKHMFGFNLRMTEMQAAIMRVQLSRMDELIERRLENVGVLINGLRDIPCLEMPKTRPGATHSYYVMPLKYKQSASITAGDAMIQEIHRDKFVAAVKAELQPVRGREHEGVTIGCGYIRPIQSMPLFGGTTDETPECARQWRDELIILHRFFGPLAEKQDLDDVINAFEKVWTHREELL